MLLRIFAAAVGCLLVIATPASAATCKASWYGPGFHGKTTASGSRYDQNALTAAHPTAPFGTRYRVTYKGRSVVVRITDRGPFTGGRCIDLSRGAASAIGMIGAGVGTVTLQRL